MTPKLTYFPIPGRAEIARIMFVASGVPFEDIKVTPGPAWLELKPSTPLGSLPVLEVDGKQLAEQAAIDRYVAKLTGYYPEDPWMCALADQFYSFLRTEVWKLFEVTFAIKDPEERIKARQAICAPGGTLEPKFALVTKLIEQKTTEFISGDKPSFADILFYVLTSSVRSGFLDGVPKDFLEPYPVLKAYRNKIANIPAIKAHYANEVEGPRSGFKPDEA